jgi:hypothetical protein
MALRASVPRVLHNLGLGHYCYFLTLLEHVAKPPLCQVLTNASPGCLACGVFVLLQLSRPQGDLLALLCHSPLGQDASGASYHHLPGLPADLRVYKCLQGSSSSSNGQVQWSTQAATLQQLQAWAGQLASSCDSREQALHAALVQQVSCCYSCMLKGSSSPLRLDATCLRAPCMHPA